MSNLSLAFTVVFPLLCMMSLGYFLKVIGIFNDNFLKELNNLCFKVFLPVVLFTNIYKSDFKTLFNIKLILFALACVIVAFLFLLIIVPRFEKENRNKSVIIQGIFRSNYILFGIPMTASLFGNDKTSVTAILIAFVIPLYNFLATVVLEMYSDSKTNPLKIAKQVLKNPLIIGSLIALSFVVVEIKLPIVIETTIADIGKVATPLALIILGGGFEFRSLKSFIKPLILSVTGKLVVMPLIFISIAIGLGFRGVELVALLGMLASPTAVSSYTMAQSMGANHELAGQVVVVSSVFSIITIFCWVTALKSLLLI